MVTTTFAGKPVPMLDSPFSKESFPNIRAKHPLVQLGQSPGEVVSSSIAYYLGEETDPHLATTCFKVVESDKVAPEPPFLQTEQPQFPELFLIRLVLQTLHQLHCSLLDTLNTSMSFV